MPTPRKIDKDGVWLVNLSEFRMPHGTRPEVIFDPKQPTCVLMDAWIEGQGEMIAQVEDPFGPVPESPVIKETPLKDSSTGKPVTGVGTGPVGTGTADEIRNQREAAKKADTKK